MGRPSDYTAELVTQICQLITEGMSLREICRREDMPDKSTVFRWLSENDKAAFHDQYARATAARAEFWAEEIIEISDDGSNDWAERQVAPGVIRRMPDPEVVNRSKLRVDARKWLMSKLQPKKYGDKLTNEHVGGDKPISIVVDTGIRRGDAGNE